MTNLYVSIQLLWFARSVIRFMIRLKIGRCVKRKWLIRKLGCELHLNEQLRHLFAMDSNDYRMETTPTL